MNMLLNENKSYKSALNLNYLYKYLKGLFYFICIGTA